MTIERILLPSNNDGLLKDLKLFISIIESSEKRKEIAINPYDFLSNGQFPVLHKFIRNSRATIMSFNRTFKKLINDINIFNPCSRCLVFVYMSILALLGRVGGGINNLLDIIDELIDLLRDFFGDVFSLGIVADFLRRLNQRISLRSLARRVCENLNQCETN